MIRRHAPSCRLAVMAAAVTCAIAGAEATQQPAPPGAPLEVVQVRDDVYLVSGDGANSIVQMGAQGVMVVDTLAAPLAGRLLEAVARLAPGKPIRYVLNTHAHPDHTGGNEQVAAAGSQLVAGNFLAQLGQQGTQSAFIVAHENVLNAMNRAAGAAAVPFAALPTDTFFQRQKDMFFNNQAVQLIHIPGAHTDGDVLVFFRKSDVIATGDIYVNDLYPRIDVARGGHVNGVIEGLNTLVDLMVSEQFTEGGTLVVPGHGRIADEIDVVEYRDMLTIVRDRVRDGIGRGQTLAQVQASRPTLDFDRRYGADTGPWTTAMFVEAVFGNLGKQGQER